MLFSLFFGNFSQQASILCVYSVFGGLTMAAPMGHLTIKFNSIKFNSLGLLVMQHNMECEIDNPKHFKGVRIQCSEAAENIKFIFVVPH